MEFLSRIRNRAAARRAADFIDGRFRRGICSLQHTFDIDNSDGATVRADLNNAIESLATNSSGTSAPGTTYAYQTWYDTTAGVKKRRNAANGGWIIDGTLDESIVLSRSSDTALDPSDFGKTIVATSGFTQTFNAASTLGDGWHVFYRIETNQSVVFNPNSAEQIDGALTKTVIGPASGIIFCTGSAFNTVGFHFRFQDNVFIGGTTNANSTLGLTINQLANDDNILTLKSSDVAHALTSGVSGSPAETDDYLSIRKSTATEGGAIVQVFGEDSASISRVLRFRVFGGQAATTDTTASVGLVDIEAGEHDGANATIAAPTNQNIFTIRALTAADTYATRLLLKGDDGELHLGNATPVALDEEDDMGLVRGLQMAISGGKGIVPTPFDNIAANYGKLREVGVVGEADHRGEFLIRVQPILNLHHGALWQLYCMCKDLAARHALLEERLA